VPLRPGQTAQGFSAPASRLGQTALPQLEHALDNAPLVLQVSGKLAISATRAEDDLVEETPEAPSLLPWRQRANKTAQHVTAPPSLDGSSRRKTQKLHAAGYGSANDLPTKRPLSLLTANRLRSQQQALDRSFYLQMTDPYSAHKISSYATSLHDRADPLQAHCRYPRRVLANGCITHQLRFELPEHVIPILDIYESPVLSPAARWAPQISRRDRRKSRCRARKGPVSPIAQKLSDA